MQERKPTERTKIDIGSPARIGSFLDLKMRAGVSIDKQAGDLLKAFAEEHGVASEFATGVHHLCQKFNRIRTREDLVKVIGLMLWLTDNFKGSVFSLRNLTYLANQDKDLDDFIESVKENYNFWGEIYGQEMFGKSDETPSSKSGIWKVGLPLPGYYLSLCGGSGSGTFACDLSLGFEGKIPRPTQLSGQIWRVGFDLELVDGKKCFRIIRTGSGQKGHNDPMLEARNKSIKKDFLEEYISSPQRLLLLMCMEIAYDLGFDQILALSTEGAMSLSSLGKSKSPIDYTSSMTDAGFQLDDGNWLKIDGFQENFYEILSNSGYAGALKPHEVRSYDMLINAYNRLRHFTDKPLPHRIEMGDKEELEKALDAYRKIHKQRKD